MNSRLIQWHVRVQSADSVSVARVYDSYAKNIKSFVAARWAASSSSMGFAANRLMVHKDFLQGLHVEFRVYKPYKANPETLCGG